MNDDIKISANVLQLISDNQAWEYYVVPKKFVDNVLTVFISDDVDVNSISNELEIILGFGIEHEIISKDKIQKLLITNYHNHSGNRSREDLSIETDFLQKLIENAYQLNSSDIHIEPYEEICRVRYRLDGRLLEKFIISKDDYPSLINKIKIRANLDIAEKRRPQDGRIKYNFEKTYLDIRVSIVPTLFGEKAVLRLLKKDTSTVNLEKIGFNSHQLNIYRESIQKDYGIVLISGPTGSGKTTTLYATLKQLNTETVNISTIEDPIEYTLEGVNQVQLNSKIGLTFSSALRTFLRQDPDIIMLGEIRDIETAEMAIRAALTGHLVLSTIHTNSAWGTISRLIDMGIPSFLLASVLNSSVAQRLIRKLCNSCKSKVPVNKMQFERKIVNDFHINIDYLHKPIGCEECHFTGYNGRIAIFEIISVNHSIGECIKENKFNIQNDISNNEFQSLYDQAIIHLKNGETSFEEVYPILLTNTI